MVARNTYAIEFRHILTCIFKNVRNNFCIFSLKALEAEKEVNEKRAAAALPEEEVAEEAAEETAAEASTEETTAEAPAEEAPAAEEADKKEE